MGQVKEKYLNNLEMTAEEYNEYLDAMDDYYDSLGVTDEDIDEMGDEIGDHYVTLKEREVADGIRLKRSRAKDRER